jgi:beta-lactamase class D
MLRDLFDLYTKKINMLKKTLAFALLSGPLSFAHGTTLCTVFIDGDSGAILSKNGEHCEERVTPASTFKIAISLMGYDNGFLIDEHKPTLPFRKGYPDWDESWRMPVDPSAWISKSVVWYSQQVTQHMGLPSAQRYVSAFQYGNEDLSGEPGKHNGLTHAWLGTSLQISPLEQAAFLRKLVNRKLPVKAHAFDMTDKITAITTLPNGWEVHGKPGSEAPLGADGNKDWNHAYGWFIGWANKGQRNIIFAHLIQDEKEEAGRAGMRARAAFMQTLSAKLDAL